MSSVWKRLTANPMTVIGLVALGLLVALALLAPVLPLPDPNVQDRANSFLRPFSDGAVLGTDRFGRDMLSRLIWGLRVSLAVGAVATVVAAVIGTAIGLVAAYTGRWVDSVLMRSIDVVMAFPYLLLALAIVAALGPGLLNALLAIAVVNVPFFARAVRGQALTIKNLDYVAAARLSGFRGGRIVVGEILPNVIPVIAVTMSTTLSWMILETAGLSFLGLGAQPPTADLGSMLGDGRDVFQTEPWTAIAPGLVILVLAIGINLVGDGVRDVLDPRLKSGVLTRPAARTARRVVEVATPADLAADTVLSVRQLTTHFEVGATVLEAVRDVSFDIRRGQTLGVVGESGSGKSVTALTVAGLVASPPGIVIDGEVWFNDRQHGPVELIRAPLGALQRVRGGSISYVFQDPHSALNPVLRTGTQVAETLVRHRGVSWSEARREAVALLDAVRLPEAAAKAKAYPHELSGGQRQRVMIAMAIANKPDLIIADEPTTALDVTTQRTVLEILRELREDSGAALMFISHDLGVVADVCDHLQVMYAGQIVEQGTTAEVLGHPSHPYTERLLRCIPDIVPVADGGVAIEAIPGLPPAVDQLPTGCAFAARCDLATADCAAAPVELRRLVDQDAAGAHSARCLYADEIGPDGGRTSVAGVA